MYVDLVLCKHSNDGRFYLFQAPRFTHLHKGSLVIVDTVHGEKEAEVVNSISCEPDTEEFNFIVDMCKATLPLKRVLKEIAYRELDYSDYSESAEIVEE